MPRTRRSTRQDPPPDPPAQPHVHGPAKPVAIPTGLERLRAVLNLSSDVDAARLCEDAALEIEHLRSRIPDRRWDDEP